MNISIIKAVKILTEKKETISAMESCTGGAFANAITNVPGASNVFEFGAVTYSNSAKIKLGVPKSVIDTHSVYSIETARQMSHAISKYTGSTYGVGITGKLGTVDPNNNGGNNNVVFVAIFNTKTDEFADFIVKINPNKTREYNKTQIINKTTEKLLNIISK